MREKKTCSTWHKKPTDFQYLGKILFEIDVTPATEFIAAAKYILAHDRTLQPDRQSTLRRDIKMFTAQENGTDGEYIAEQNRQQAAYFSSEFEKTGLKR